MSICFKLCRYHKQEDNKKKKNAKHVINQTVGYRPLTRRLQYSSGVLRENWTAHDLYKAHDQVRGSHCIENRYLSKKKKMIILYATDSELSSRIERQKLSIYLSAKIFYASVRNMLDLEI